MPSRPTLRLALAAVVAVAAVNGLHGSVRGAPGPPAGGALAASGVPEPVLRPPVPGALVRGFEPPASSFGPGHRGVDFAARPGTGVGAPASGRVSFAGQVGGVRWVALTVQGAALLSIGPLADLRVRAGQPVDAGDLLGAAGGEGAVHLGLRIAGAYTDPLPHLARPMRPRLVPLTGPAGRATPGPLAPEPAVLDETARPREGARP